MKKTLLFLGAALLGAYGGKAQLTNGNMEAWRSYTVSNTSLEAPTGWRGLDSNIATFSALTTPQKQVFKDTSAHGGSFAARLVSKNYSSVSLTAPGVIANGDITLTIIPTVDYYITGGTATNQRNASVSAWIKYTPGGTGDNGLILVRAILQGTTGANGRDSVIGEGTMNLGATPNYTQMTVPIIYTNATRTPTHIQVGFVSSNLATAVDGSTLYVDDVVLNVASGMKQAHYNADVIKCYPNPTTGILHLTSNAQEMLHWEAISVTGQVIAQQSVTGSANADLGNTPAGTYYFRVLDKNKNVLQTGKFTRL